MPHNSCTSFKFDLCFSVDDFKSTDDNKQEETVTRSPFAIARGGRRFFLSFHVSMCVCVGSQRQPTRFGSFGVTG